MSGKSVNKMLFPRKQRLSRSYSNICVQAIRFFRFFNQSGIYYLLEDFCLSAFVYLVYMEIWLYKFSIVIIDSTSSLVNVELNLCADFQQSNCTLPSLAAGLENGEQEKRQRNTSIVRRRRRKRPTHERSIAESDSLAGFLVWFLASATRSQINDDTGSAREGSLNKTPHTHIKP